MREIEHVTDACFNFEVRRSFPDSEWMAREKLNSGAEIKKNRGSRIMRGEMRKSKSAIRC